MLGGRGVLGNAKKIGGLELFCVNKHERVDR